MRFEKGQPTQGRLVLAAEAARLAKTGMMQREIAEQMGCSRSYVSSLLTDPTGEKDRARKESYRGTCEKCGKGTAGCNGPGLAPKLCVACHIETVRVVEHGRTRYHGGCRCDECRRAQREYQFKLRKSGRPVPNHGASGYQNYDCRCDICKEAYSIHQWMRPEYKLRHLAKRKRMAA